MNASNQNDLQRTEPRAVDVLRSAANTMKHMRGLIALLQVKANAFDLLFASKFGSAPAESYVDGAWTAEELLRLADRVEQAEAEAEAAEAQAAAEAAAKAKARVKARKQRAKKTPPAEVEQRAEETPHAEVEQPVAE